MGTKAIPTSPLDPSTDKNGATFLPILMLCFSIFGSSIIRQALPTIPFLLPSGCFLLMYFFCWNTGKFSFCVRGMIKTICALFFLASAIQNTLSFQLHQSFLPLPYNVLQDMVNESATFHALEYIEAPRFLVISFADHVPICTTPSAQLNEQYAKEIQESSNALELSEKLSDVVDLHCVELVQLFSFPSVITIGVTPDSWKFTNKGPTSNPLGLLRALHTLSQRSIIFVPSFMIDLYHAIITHFQLQSIAPLLSDAPNSTSTPPPSTSTQAIITLAGNLTQFQTFMLIGFIFCALGDVLLIFGKVDIAFLLGLVSFLLGHVNFVIAYFYTLFHVRIKHLPSFPIQACFFALFFVWTGFTIFRWLLAAKKLKGAMQYAVVVYFTVIALMVCTAWCIGFAIPPALNSTNVVPKSLYDMEYKPLIHDSLIHVVSVCMRAPMFLSTQIGFFLGLTDHNPISIAQTELFSHFTISNESFCSFFIVFGSTFFMLSDILVAREKFVKPTLSNQTIGLPLYFFAQLLLANTVLYM